MTDMEGIRHLRITHTDGKFGVARLKNDDHNLAEDEPVFVFRGSDKHLARVLEAYYDLCENDGSPSAHLATILQSRERVLLWQHDNPDKVKTPD